MSENACVMCRYWNGKAGEESAECRRFGPTVVQYRTDLVVPRPWPRTLAEDWCYFFASIGGIPGGRGNRLTNVEILAYIEEAGGIEPEDLIEKLQVSGLSATMARRRMGKLVQRKQLVADEELLVVPPEGPKPDGELAPEGAVEKVDRSALPREKFVAIVRTIADRFEAAKPFNEIFKQMNEIVVVGKSTFTRLLKESLEVRDIQATAGTRPGYWAAPEQGIEAP